MHESVLIALYAAIVSSCFCYIAWFKPDLHRKLLGLMSRLYSGWDRTSAEWTVSQTNFWLTRIVVTVMFVFSWIALFCAIAKL